MTPGGDGWTEWRVHVLKELERNTIEHREMNVKLDLINARSIKNQVKLSIASAIVGAITAALITLFLKSLSMIAFLAIRFS